MPEAPMTKSPSPRVLTLCTDEVRVTILPDKGADIYEIIDLNTGIDIMFKAPWGIRDPGPWLRSANSMQRWMEAYCGGWQVLLPNGGDECIENGAQWSYHGEAALLPWQVSSVSQTSATLTTSLFSVPLSVRRELQLSGSTFIVREEVRNESSERIEVMWSHHPAFGAPFLEEGCLLATGFRTVVADDLAPGTLLASNSRHSWPTVQTKDGDTLDLRRIPGPEQPRAILAYLTDLDEPFFAITNPRVGLGVCFRWSPEVFDKAWLWQEVHTGAGWPWYRRTYAVAVEPASTIPGHGMSHARTLGNAGITLGPWERREILIEATLYHDSRPVTGVDADGSPRFE